MTTEQEVLKTLNWLKERIDNASALSAWPVGSVFISVNDTNPSTLLGGGTWQKIEDCFLLASGKKALGDTGGEENVTLSVDQIPSHNHGGTFSGSGTTSSAGDHTHTRGSMNINGWFTLGQNAGRKALVDGTVFKKRGTATLEAVAAAAAYDGEYVDFNANGNWTGSTSSNGEHTHTFSVSGNINNQGGGQSHNNMPPYRVVSVWQRIA
nr:MAG TPA: Baseplate structural protein [Caudoviricetes sp.]